MSKVFASTTKLKNVATVTYIILLHLIVVVIMVIYLDSKGVATKDQVKNLAIGYALKECLAQHSSDIDCGSIVVDDPEGSCFEWYCNDPPLWAIGYHTTSGKEFRGSFHIDIYGHYVSNEDVEKLYT